MSVLNLPSSSSSTVTSKRLATSTSSTFSKKQRNAYGQFQIQGSGAASNGGSASNTGSSKNSMLQGTGAASNGGSASNTGHSKKGIIKNNTNAQPPSASSTTVEPFPAAKKTMLCGFGDCQKCYGLGSAGAHIKHPVNRGVYGGEAYKLWVAAREREGRHICENRVYRADSFIGLRAVLKNGYFRSGPGRLADRKRFTDQIPGIYFSSSLEKANIYGRHEGIDGVVCVYVKASMNEQVLKTPTYMEVNNQSWVDPKASNWQGTEDENGKEIEISIAKYDLVKARDGIYDDKNGEMCSSKPECFFMVDVCTQGSIPDEFWVDHSNINLIHAEDPLFAPPICTGPQSSSSNGAAAPSISTRDPSNGVAPVIAPSNGGAASSIAATLPIIAATPPIIATPFNGLHKCTRGGECQRISWALTSPGYCCRGCEDGMGHGPTCEHIHNTQ